MEEGSTHAEQIAFICQECSLDVVEYVIAQRRRYFTWSIADQTICCRDNGKYHSHSKDIPQHEPTDMKKRYLRSLAVDGL